MSLWRELPPRLEPLRDLALDLRWTWSHEADALWETSTPRLWQRTRNPWSVLQDVARNALQRLAADPDFREKLDRCSWRPGTHI